MKRMAVAAAALAVLLLVPSLGTAATWTNQDIGSVAAAGSSTNTTNADGTVTATVKGSGSDIWDVSDEFQFDFQALSGDGTITARVASLQHTDDWAKAGVMIRETLAANSRHALVAVTPANGVAFQRRTTTGGQSTHNYGPSVAAPYWVRLTRSGNSFSAYSSADGTTWSLIATDTIAMAASVYIGLAVTSHLDGTLNTATFDHVVITGSPPPAGGWSNQDVGSVGAAGSSTNTTNADGTVTATVKGSGADIWDVSDEFQFDFQSLSGDGTITARVASETNTDAWAKAGVMIRESLAANSRHALVAVTPSSGVAFQRRTATGGTTAHSYGPMVAPPYWVRLTRTGNTFSAYSSADGTTWSLIATDTITMAAAVYVGLAVTSHHDGTLNTASFDHVVIGSAGPPPAGWSNQDVGSVGAAGSSTNTTNADGTVTATVKGSGSDIWDVADEFQFDFQTLAGDGTITARVASQTDTDPWAKAGVMIRETLAPNSRHALVAVTPSNGIAFQRRTTTGGTSDHTYGPTGVTAPYWVRLTRSGNTFNAYASPDGTTWTFVGQISMTMATSAYVGLAVTSHHDGTLGAASFDHVTVSSSGAPTVSLTANPASVQSGGTTQLSWTSTNATSCTASGGWSGSRATSGGETSSALSVTTTFTLTCTGAGGSASDSETVTVGSSGAVSVDLTLAGNVYALVNDVKEIADHKGIDGAGNAYLRTSIGSSVTWAGVTFTLGAAGTKNGVAGGAGVTVKLPTGHYSSVRLLATAVNGKQPSQTFVVHYNDTDPSTTITQSLSDWSDPRNYQGESRAPVAAVTVSGTPVYLYGYALAINGARTVSSIELPAKSQVVVVAMELITADPTTYSSACNPHTYGAMGDGRDSTTYIQDAIEACSAQGGGGVVELSAQYGTSYLTYPITLKSNVQLQIDSGVTLKAKWRVNDSTYTPAYINWVYQPREALISAQGADHVGIVGNGVIDGAGNDSSWSALASQEVAYPDSPYLPSPSYLFSLRPWLLEFYQCDTVTISGVKLTDPPYWTQALRFSKNITEYGVVISGVVPNSDGVDVVGSTDVTLSDLNIGVADDNIAIKSGLPILPGDSKEVGLPKMAAARVRVSNIFAGRNEDGLTAGYGSGIVIGSEASNGVNDVTIQNVYLNDTTYGFRIKSERDRGGEIYGIKVQDMFIAHAWYPVIFETRYRSAPIYGQQSEPAPVTATVKGSGSDIWDVSDEFQFDYQTMTGDGTITARLASQTNTDPWAKAGVMIRETLGANSTHALMAVTPGNGVAFQRRTTTGGTTAHTYGPAVTAPYWVRLTRSGSTFSAYASADGTTWSFIGQTTITMAASVYVGLAVTSHHDGTLSTASFDRVVIAPQPGAWPAGWSNRDVGSVGAAGSSTNATVNATTPNIHDITLDTVTATRSMKSCAANQDCTHASAITGLPESCIRHVTLNNVTIESDETGILLRHMTGVFTAVTNTPAAPPPEENVTVKNAAGGTLLQTNPMAGQVACAP